jgi:hypothetical protein
MSEFFICIIPEDPFNDWGEKDKNHILSEVKKLFTNCEKVELIINDYIQLRDCGDNLESIECPRCKEEIDYENWEEFIKTDFNKATNGFDLKKYKLNCCGSIVSLNDLKYSWNQGFSKWEISIMNPDMGEITDLKKINRN